MEKKLPFDIRAVRLQFPALDQLVYNKPFVYLDNAATTQKPRVVIDRVKAWYELENSNIHRGVHYLSQQGTIAFENARQTVANFINSKSSREIIFTKGTTDSMNLLASSLGKLLVKEGDSVLVTGMEHHSNFVPWQQLCVERKANFLVAGITENGEVDLDHYTELLEKKPKIVSIAHVSNVLGTINPIEEMIRLAHVYDIPVVIDGAQSICNQKIDVQALDCDFFAFSGHKMYAPMGVGVLFGKEKWLDAMPPYQFGGEMVNQVSIDETSFNVLPFKFEAGTPNVSAVLGLESAINFIETIGNVSIAAYKDQLIQYALQRLAEVKGIKFIGNPVHRASVISFLIDEIHPYDAGMIIDKLGIAIRTGHHCAQPIMERFGIPGTMRASFAMYNTFEEIDIFVAAVKKAAIMLS
ncbi:MAG: cysteine desulfurase [Bacteroidales bacterium]|nr:cysteine desulfurase [Bacteroidales bacterium]